MDLYEKRGDEELAMDDYYLNQHIDAMRGK